jgi:hypothetical protein
MFYRQLSMTTKAKYLTKASKLISHLPPHDRAQVLSHVNKRITLECESAPSKSEAAVLKQLGPIYNMLNEYLIASGHSPIKPVSNFWKYFLISTTLLIVLVIATSAFFISKFTPLFKEEKGRIIILGGLIDINPDLGSVKVLGNFDMNMKNNHAFNGSHPVIKDKITKAIFDFKNGKITVLNSKDNLLHWDCLISAPIKSSPVSNTSSIFKIQLTQYNGVQCDLQIPKGVQLDMTGVNGNITYEQPLFENVISLKNGNIEFTPKEGTFYNFITNFQNTRTLQDKLFNDPSGLLTDIKLANGNLSIR